MLLPRRIPQSARRFNREWHAPFGNELVRRVVRYRRDPLWWFPRLVGPFGFQPNNDTRVIEYPWAFHAVDLRPGLQVVDVGGSLGGFQFALARAGCTVTNVDPGENATGIGWPVDRRSIAHLNRAFKTDVHLEPCTLQEADLPSAAIDVVYSISTIEHIPAEELPGVAAEVQRILKPGGHAVLTIDLFLDLAPFTSRHENKWGTNADVRQLIEDSGLDMIEGDPAQLAGFDTFNPDEVLSNLADYYVGHKYPTCVQAVVLRKAGSLRS